VGKAEGRRGQAQLDAGMLPAGSARVRGWQEQRARVSRGRSLGTRRLPAPLQRWPKQSEEDAGSQRGDPHLAPLRFGNAAALRVRHPGRGSHPQLSRQINKIVNEYLAPTIPLRKRFFLAGKRADRLLARCTTNSRIYFKPSAWQTGFIMARCLLWYSPPGRDSKSKPRALILFLRRQKNPVPQTRCKLLPWDRGSQLTTSLANLETND